ncbi:AAA family ATPase [Bacillus sp. REN16]|uniref:AAA family ATPase n=1 Tax=Bacillus sp. REN16 TaxID=2887296 RepID=UPI001E4F2E9B|nr:SMC family ATPase [Bacillus sp. REN16]MCC3359117.1 SMC family ATPase [Bacillus sp. REN16]
MRPIKLSMTAFGPYKDTEVIDFTELKNNRLFVISGNTGAGKTTIFDAICFALYGSASGEDRSDTRYMRSDFADDDVYTAVELEFELHSRHYRVRRQLPHIKQGNKSATGDQYEFYEKIDGREVPCVDRQIVSEINKRVEELVGLTKDQFSQIVMLPQGEFRKLLTSQTENKEEILRKIFRTGTYREINDRLKIKKKFAEDTYNREAETRNRYIGDIQATLPLREDSLLFDTLAQEHLNTHQVVAGLDEETTYYQQDIAAKKQQEQEVGLLYNTKLEEFHKAEAIIEKFTKLEEKNTTLQGLKSLEHDYTGKEKQLENANRASKIETYEVQVNEWRQDVSVKSKRLIEAKNNCNAALQQFEAAQKKYQFEENRKSEREQVSRRLEHLNEFLPTIQGMDRKKAYLSAQKEQVVELEKEIKSLKENLTAEKLEKNQQSQLIKEVETATDHLGNKQQTLNEMRERVKILQDFLKLINDKRDLERNVESKKENYTAIKKEYDKLEEAWVNGQASILAATHLHDGQACPVCGSLEHPHKAEGQDSVPSKEEMERVKSVLAQNESEYRQALAELKVTMESLQRHEAELEKIRVQSSKVSGEYQRLVEEGKRLKQDVDSLVKEKDKLGKLRIERDKKEKHIEQLETKLNEMAEIHQQQNTSYETKKAVYEEQLSRIPEDVRNLGVLQQKIAETEALKKTLETAWETAQKQLQVTKEEVAKATANETNAESQLHESKMKKDNAEKQFLEALQQAEFSTEDQYLHAKLSEQDREQLKEAIDQYNQQVSTLTQQVKELNEELKDKTKVDLEELSAILTEQKNAFEKAQEAVRQSKQHFEKSMELKEKITEAEQKVADFEKRLNIIADLYDVVRGQNNKKISFERYLQIEYLEQIIIAANERLKQLSNGQFMLLRSDRQESRGKQSGLGLDVYDSYTGQTRDVKTLSGGEKFNASLCLALGMADVIQSFQGGVSIDTMFIDEGFGSLDEESLNKAIDTLIDLQQSGRMIGVISHVQELKNTIPATLEVNKTREGHSQTKFVVR